MNTILLAGLEHSLGNNAVLFMEQYLKACGYHVLRSETCKEILSTVDQNIVTWIILDVRFVTDTYDEEHPLIRFLPSNLPTLTLGKSRSIGYDWIKDAAYGSIHEYAHIPIDMEEIVAKIKKIGYKNEI